MPIRKTRIAENAPSSTPVYTASGRLAAGTQFSLAGADAVLFEVSATGVVTLKAPADYESRSSYSFDLVMTGARNATQTILVSVTNVNDNAPVFTSGTTAEVVENTRARSAIYQAQVSDADGSNIRYTLSGEDAALLRISATGIVTLKEPPDFEAKASYSFDVVASDGVHTVTRSVVVSVVNVNDAAPVFTSGGTGEATEGDAAGTVIYTAVATDADGDDLSYSLAGADAALLDISADGEVSLKSTADYETQSSYSFSVVASDGTHATTQAVAVPVANVAPTLAISSSAAVLQEGESATITFTFSEDPGASFTQGDVVVSGGTLGALEGSGLTRTATFTAASGAYLTTGGQVTVLPGNFTDAGGMPGAGAPATVHIDTVFNEILFVGNSATFGRDDPVMSYNTYDAETNPGGVHDLTSPAQGGTFTNLTGANLYEPHDWGGVPALVDMFAQQAGLSYDISLSTRNAATLRGHYGNTSPGGWDLRGNIASQEWDMVVLQDQTDEPLPQGSGSITFLPGSSSATLVLTPTGDSAQEYDETFALTLARSTGYRVGTSSAVTATILNDDPNPPTVNPALPTVTLVAAQGSAAEDGNGNLVFTFTRTGPTTSPLTVTFAAVRDGATNPSVSNPPNANQDLVIYTSATGAVSATGGTGTSPYRFTAGNGWATSSNTGGNTTTGSISFTTNTGTIVIPAGQASASITMDPFTDATVESDESIKLTLTGTAYNIGTQGQVAATIVNDDFAPGTDTSLPNVTLALTSAATAYENAGQNLVYTFTRSGSTAEALTVYFNELGTATYFSGSPSQSDFSVSTTGASASSLETASGNNADIAAFETYATLIENYIHTGASDTTSFPGTTIPANTNASAETDVYLYATWARPDMVYGAWDMLTEKVLQPNGAWAGGTVSQSTTQAAAYYLALEEMSADLTAAYTNLANVNPDFEGVAPVSTAFMNAVLEGISIRDPYTETAQDSVAEGKINLWYQDNLHASKYGSYLAGLVLFETLTGIDAQALGAGDQVAADLGIDGATAVALQQVASATLGFTQGYHWSAPGSVSDLGDTDAAATLATAGGFTFVDATYDAHTVSVQSQDGNLGTLQATVRSDGHAGQVNWLYTVNNAVVDPVLDAGEERMEYFTVLLDDGNGHVSAEIVGVTLSGTAAAL